MWFLRELIFVTFLAVTCQAALKEFKKKPTVGFKRAVETYAYTVPGIKTEEKSASAKPKVVVETIKSISPPEYLTPTGHTGSSFETNAPKGKVPVGSVTYNAFEADSSNKAPSVESGSTETLLGVKNKPNYRYYSGSSTQQSTTSTQISSTIQPAPVRTTSVEPTTTLLPGYQYTSRSVPVSQSSASGHGTFTDKPIKIISIRGKVGNGRYSLPKIVKKPTKLEPKHADSKPEETGLNGYHYDVGSLSFASKHSGSQSNMMGASYMRSSSPFYNYHVMLD